MRPPIGGPRLITVIPGDAIHLWRWHQHGLTPTPGTNPLVNTAYAVHSLGAVEVLPWQQGLKAIGW